MRSLPIANVVPGMEIEGPILEPLADCWKREALAASADRWLLRSRRMRRCFRVAGARIRSSPHAASPGWGESGDSDGVVSGVNGGARQQVRAW